MIVSQKRSDVTKLLTFFLFLGKVITFKVCSIDHSIDVSFKTPGQVETAASSPRLRGLVGLINAS